MTETKKDSCVRVVAFVPNAVHKIIRGQRKGDLQKFLLAAIEEKLDRDRLFALIEEAAKREIEVTNAKDV
jgi:hypothetical protein